MGRKIAKLEKRVNFLERQVRQIPQESIDAALQATVTNAQSNAERLAYLQHHARGRRGRGNGARTREPSEARSEASAASNMTREEIQERANQHVGEARERKRGGRPHGTKTWGRNRQK